MDASIIDSCDMWMELMQGLIRINIVFTVRQCWWRLSKPAVRLKHEYVNKLTGILSNVIDLIWMSDYIQYINRAVIIRTSAYSIGGLSESVARRVATIHIWQLLSIYMLR